MKWRRRRFQRLRKSQRIAAVVLKPFFDWRAAADDIFFEDTLLVRQVFASPPNTDSSWKQRFNAAAEKKT